MNSANIQTEAIKLKSMLASTPKSKPIYSVQVTTEKGNTYCAVDPKATRALIALMDMQATLGGAASHYGGPAAMADLMSALYAIVFNESLNRKSEWHECFHIINDAGHCENGLYALQANYGFADFKIADLKEFRSLNGPFTGHGEVHCYPKGVHLSNGPLGSSFPQAQGLALADAINGRRERVTVAVLSDGACFEGDVKEAFAAIPGFAKKNRLAKFLCILSDNNTKLSGRIDKDSYDMQPTFSALETLGWHKILLENAHDLTACFNSIETALDLLNKEPNRPIVIQAKTIKGFGVKKTMDAANGGHGFPISNPKDLLPFLNEIYAGESLPQEFRQWADSMTQESSQSIQKIKKAAAASAEPIAKDKIQSGVGWALIEKKRSGLPLIAVTADLASSTGVGAFIKEFPQSSIDVGVSEVNMISSAIGLSKEGFIPVIDTFAQFGVTKCSLPLMMASLSNAPIIAIFSHTGLQDAADGASHQALSYVAMVSSIPNVKVYSLTCSEEAESLVGQAIDNFQNERNQGKIPNSVIFFLGRENFPLSYQENATYSLDKAQILLDRSREASKTITIAAAGSLLAQALKASEDLFKEGIGTIVINPSIINQPDIETFRKSLKKSKGKLLTIEDHQIIGGMGAILVHALLLDNISLNVKSIGIKGKFGRSAYQASELYRIHNMDSQAITEICKNWMD